MGVTKIYILKKFQIFNIFGTCMRNTIKIFLNSNLNIFLQIPKLFYLTIFVKSIFSKYKIDWVRVSLNWNLQIILL